MRQRLDDPPRRPNEVDPVVVVLLDASGDREDVRVEDDILGGEAGLFRQDPVGAAANRHLALLGVGLALFVEGHDDDGGPVGTAKAGVAQERLLALLERDRIHDRLALDAFQPGLDHFPFRAVDHHRHAGDIWLGGDEVKVRGHNLRGVDQALVHVDVDDLGAVLDLVARHLQRRRVVAGGDQLAEPSGAGDVGALADIHEGNFLRQRERLEPGEPHQRLDLGHLARWVLRHRLRDGADMLGRGAAAAADDVDQPLARELVDLRRHELRTFVVGTEGVRQAGVGIGAGEGVGDLGDLGEVRAHRLRTESAVQAHGKWPRMADRVPEPGRGLAGEGAAREVGDGAGDHQRQAQSGLGKDLLGREDRRFGVQRVEDRLYKDKVGAAVHQPADLPAIGGPQVVERHGTVAGIVHVRGDRRGAVGGPQRTRHEAAPAVLGLGAAAGVANQLGAASVEVIDPLLHRVVGLGNDGRGEGVGLDDVGARDGVAVVDLLDRLRLGEDQEVVVALLRVVVDRTGPVSREVVLRESEPLNLRPHGAVEDQDALPRRGGERHEHVLAVGDVVGHGVLVHWSSSPNRGRPLYIGDRSDIQRAAFRQLQSGKPSPIQARAAPVAQLDRALPSEGRGHRFESCRVRHKSFMIPIGARIRVS